MSDFTTDPGETLSFSRGPRIACTKASLAGSGEKDAEELSKGPPRERCSP